MNLFFEHVLFSIDDWDKLRTSMRFEKYLDMRVAANLCKPVSKGIGKWGSTYETCYLMDKRDFDKFVLGTTWVENQECYALIPGDVRQPVVLVEMNPEFEGVRPLTTVKGPMKVYDYEPDGDWTYMDGKFWSF